MQSNSTPGLITNRYRTHKRGIACSTCHVIFESAMFEVTLDNDPWSDEECDMLDNALNNTDT